jgi:hypothetical protein
VARQFRAGGFCAGLSALLAVLAPLRAACAEPLLLDVLVIDAVGTPQDVLEEAREAGSRLFRRIDVHVTWLDPPAVQRRREALEDPLAQRAFIRSLYVVRLVAPAGGDRLIPTERVLGSAVAGTRLATVAYRRVEERALSGGASVGLALGHVVAHELGHLLLGRTVHTAAGLMQPMLNVQQARQGLLFFSEEEGRTIRGTLERDAARTP